MTEFTDVLETHGADPSMDLVNTSHGPMRRHEADKLPQAPKTGIALLKQLEHQRQTGKLTETQYAELRIAAQEGREIKLPDEAQVAASAAKEREIADANEYAAADNELLDFVEELDEKYLMGGKLSEKSQLALQERWMNLAQTAAKFGYGMDYPRLVLLKDFIDSKRREWRSGS